MNQAAHARALFAALELNLKMGGEQVWAASAARAGPGWADEEPFVCFYFSAK
jgi:hypothetical protein